MEIWLISGKYCVAQKVKEILQGIYPKADIYEFYRDYHFEDATKSAKPDIMVSDGTCKTRPNWCPEESVGIYYSEPAIFAGKQKIFRSSFFPLGFGYKKPSLQKLLELKFKLLMAFGRMPRANSTQ